MFLRKVFFITINITLVHLTDLYYLLLMSSAVVSLSFSSLVGFLYTLLVAFAKFQVFSSLVLLMMGCGANLLGIIVSWKDGIRLFMLLILGSGIVKMDDNLYRSTLFV